MAMRMRSRGGCSRCKARKLKCDEARPRCGRCRRSKVECPGYAHGLRWSTKHEMLPQAARAEVSGTQGQDGGSPSHSQDSGSLSRQPLEGAGRQQPQITRQRHTSQSCRRTSLSIDQSVTTSADVCAVLSPALQDDGEPTYWNSNVEFNPMPTDPSPASDVVLGANDYVGNSDEANIDAEFSVPEESRAIDSSGFVQYYLDKLCPLHSLIQGPEDPFRMFVLDYLQDSSLIRDCIVSISAMHYHQNRMDMISVSVECHSNAIQSLACAIARLGDQRCLGPSLGLEDDISRIWKLKETLFASIILGLSSPWYDPKDLGIPHLQGARRLCEEFLNILRNDLNESPVDTMSDREKSFLIGSMAYWEAAAAFTIDQPLSSINYLLPFLVEPDVINLNPLTGVCTPVFINLARVAVCARQQRMMAKIHPLGWDEGAVHAVSQDILTVARTSMTFALNYHASCPTVTQDLGDSTRRLLQLISEIYNLACLVEVYRSFPCLMGSDDDPGTISSPATSSGGGSSGGRNQCQSGIQLQSAGYLIQDLALTMLDLLQELPERHNSTLWQTIPLIISGSVLHISSKPLHYTRTNDCDLSVSTPSLLRKLQSIKLRGNKVDKLRSFIRRRMRENSKTFGLEPIYERAEQLLEHVWELGDPDSAERSGALLVGVASSIPKSLPIPNWIDVMVKNDLETFFG